MELQFDKTLMKCLRRVLCESDAREQTQEIRLPDAMPDVGNILGCWGQCVIRSKEWRSDCVSVSGGVQAKVLYMSEEAGMPQCCECWIPFQMKWDLPEGAAEGSIVAVPVLKSMDARTLSARKIMVRSVVSIHMQAMEPTQFEICKPLDPPEDVKLLVRTYPVELPVECSEKAVRLDEEITLPGPSLGKLVGIDLCPVVSEHRILAGRLVFRGSCAAHVVYMAEDGSIHNCDLQIPMSQYVDLDMEYGSAAEADMKHMVTNLEIDKGEDGKLYLKATLSCQYTVFDRVMLEVVEDAYSPRRQLKLYGGTLSLPARLEDRSVTLHDQQSIPVQAQRICDVQCCADHPSISRNGDQAEISCAVHYQILYYDENGDLQCTTARSEQTEKLELSDLSDPVCGTCGCRNISAEPGAGDLNAQTEICIQMQTYCADGIRCVTGIELGELADPDPARPSLILRRASSEKLWDIAKACGSSVEAICIANGITAEPEDDRILLIPVN